MNLFFLKTSIIRWILVVVVFLTVAGVGAYYYTCREAKLTFHSDWTETDRQQMQEIMDFLKEQKATSDQSKDEDWKKLLDSLSFDRIKNGKSLWRDFCKWRRRYNEQNPFSYLDQVVAQTAKMGNAAYVGEDNWTLLHLACGLQKKELAAHLIDKGADCNIRVQLKREDGIVPGDMPLHYLFMGGLDGANSAETVLFLMEKLAARGADFNARSAGDVMFPFELLCSLRNRYTEEEQEKIISKLINLGGDVVSPGRKGNRRISPFSFPLFFGRVVVVRRLCEAGADVNEGYDSLPPLFQLTPFRSEETMEMARMLLDNGAQVNGRIQHRPANESVDVGQTPLSYLCAKISNNTRGSEEEKKRCFDLVSLYLDRGADVNLASVEGMTPLMYLLGKWSPDRTREVRLEVARMLLNHGADPALKNDKGETLRDMVKKYTDDEKEVREKLPKLFLDKEKADSRRVKE